MEILTWTLSEIVIKIYISHAYNILLMTTANHFIIKTRQCIPSNMYPDFSFDLSVQSTKVGPRLSLQDQEQTEIESQKMPQKDIINIRWKNVDCTLGGVPPDNPQLFRLASLAFSLACPYTG